MSYLLEPNRDLCRPMSSLEHERKNNDNDDI